MSSDLGNNAVIASDYFLAYVHLVGVIPSLPPPFPPPLIPPCRLEQQKEEAEMGESPHNVVFSSGPDSPNTEEEELAEECFSR